MSALRKGTPSTGDGNGSSEKQLNVQFTKVTRKEASSHGDILAKLFEYQLQFVSIIKPLKDFAAERILVLQGYKLTEDDFQNLSANDKFEYECYLDPVETMVKMIKHLKEQLALFELVKKDDYTTPSK